MITRLEEFKEKGFTKSDSNLRKKLRSRREKFKIFNACIFRCNSRNPRYGSNEIFGNPYFVYYYDIERSQEFVEFLVEKFHAINPNPNKDTRSAFTKILHHHNLCWNGCYHSKRGGGR